nr:integrase, catalytic region, zinc finger, CCHC-type, peptidase aspartic, catalytic [Tanacetum cinerariifolium]
MKNKVEAQPRNVNKKNRVVEPICNVDVKQSQLNANSELICATCKKSMFDGVHDRYLLDFVKNVNSRAKSAKKPKNRNHSQLMNFVSKFLGTVRFGNDHFARIIGYGDYQLGNVTISRVYYIEGIGHNLFSVGKFYDADLEVAFQKNTCFIRNLEGVDLIFGSCDTNLNTISLDDMLKTSLICLLSKASKTKSWLWHRRFVWLDACGEYSREKTLREFYENVGISHQISVSRTPQQNGVVKRQNRTLVEAGIMLIFSKAPLFLWAKAINTACYIQNRLLIRLQDNKTSYELMQDKKPDLSFFYVFVALCYPTNDNDDQGLVPNTVSQQPCIPPNRVAAAPRAVDLADSPLSTSIDQDALSISIPSTQEQEHSPSIS